MRKVLIILFVFAGKVLLAQTADDIINKHFEAIGGKEKWGRVFSIKYSGNYVLGPGMLAPVTQIEVAKPFKGTYSDFTWQGMTTKGAMRADSGWRYEPFSGKREADPLSAEDIRTEKLKADPQSLLFNYKEKGYTVEYLGTEDMDGSDVYKIRLTTKEGDVVHYFIDADTWYILKEIKRVKLKDKEEKSYGIFSDFKKIDFGVTVPFSYQEVDENGKEQGGPVLFTKVEINATIDPGLFDKPKGK